MVKIQIEEHKHGLKVQINKYKVSKNETNFEKLLTEIIEDVITEITEKQKRSDLI